jgi:SAM-dependent methyltransferase
MSKLQPSTSVESGLASVRALIEAARPRDSFGLAWPSEVQRVRALLQQASVALTELERASRGESAARALDEYRGEIDRFNAGQPNHDLLDAIRAYNHTIIDALHAIRPLPDLSVLDLGASPHGYALEHALARGAASYVGIGLDVDDPVCIRGPAGIGVLKNEDGEQLTFSDASFDLVVSMSTFEHVAHVDRVLAEIRRVLKPGGQALVTFEPIWTCSYGHHLHHFGPIASHVPDWSHLLWTKEEMAANLAARWPADASLSLADAIAWTYDSDAINRIGIREMRDYFARGPLKVEWIVPLADANRDPDRLALVSRTVALTADELMTKGLTALLTRV